MTTTPNRSTEIASYLAAVERHLNDLPTHIRQDLMSELDAHLSEVAADLEPGAALRDLLGSPEAYARELRETAEVAKEPAAARMRRKLADAAAPALTRLKGAADGYAASTGYADAAELRERLRPGWWVLRGALVAALFVYWLSAAQYGVTGYSIFGSIPGLLLLVAVLLVGVWVSMRLGMKSREWHGRRARWTNIAGIALVALVGYQFMWLGVSAPVEYVETTDYGAAESSASDVYVYDEDGNLLTGVYLFDQDGNPLWIGDPEACPIAENDPFATPTEDVYEDPYASADERFGYQYPLCVPGDRGDMTMPPSEDESAFPSETPGEDETPSASEGPSESETPTGEESPVPGETATPTPDEATTE